MKDPGLVETVHGLFHWFIIEQPDGQVELVLHNEVKT